MKINGFTRAYHPFQLISYVFFALDIITFYFLILPLSTEALKVQLPNNPHQF